VTNVASGCGILGQNRNCSGKILCDGVVYLDEEKKYIAAAAEKPDFHSGLPIWRLRKVEDYVREQLAQEISTETLAELVELSPFHFSRVFKQATGMSPLQIHIQGLNPEVSFRLSPE
jgi:hypothetical protein